MKRIIDYINEALLTEDFSSFTVKDLKVEYKCAYSTDSDYIDFYVPAAYSEDDFMVYLNDMFLNELPASEKFDEDNFGETNASNIYDVYFTFDRYEKYTESKGDFINWDAEKDSRYNTERDDFCFVHIKGLKYHIAFDEFEFKDVDSTDKKKTITTVFSSFNANDNNKYPLHIKFNENNIIYKE